MMPRSGRALIGTVGLVAMLVSAAVVLAAQERPLPTFERAPTGSASFFVTSTGSGRGGDLGGLEGADRHCKALAATAGLPARDWRAYLSTQASGSQRAVNARDRIGHGPWFNVKGGRVAANLADLHGDTIGLAQAGNLVGKATALTEKGDVVPGEGDTPKYHDILTGTRLDGRAFADGFERTCSNWTNGGSNGSAQVGHSDRNSRTASISWNSAHPTLGCNLEKLADSGGSGLFYCFAADQAVATRLSATR